MKMLPSLDIVFLTEDISSNSLGRTYCLWDLAKKNGFTSTVLSTQGEDVWAPLRNTDFAQSVKRLDGQQALRPWNWWRPDLVIAVKPLPRSFGLARRWKSATDVPILLDIDDPDLEETLSIGQPIKRLAKAVLRPHRNWPAERLRAATRSTPTIVSNPVLQNRYGGVIIPHVRPDYGPGAPHKSTAPTVAFVGTNRPHKGVDLLREAVKSCQHLGYQLVVTDVAPVDPHPWEQWIGGTSLDEGIALVGRSDVVITPSLDTIFAHGQFPAKIVDAMILGRAIAVSDIEPMRWALGDGGLLLVPGSTESIIEALREFADPSRRTELGRRARERALKLFTNDGNAAIFAQACLSAVRSPELLGRNS